MSVAHGGDPATVLGLLRDVAGRDPRVAGAPSPEALFVRMGRESLDFELRMWTDDPAWARVRSDVGVAVERALREANIALPRPEGFFAGSVSD